MSLLIMLSALLFLAHPSQAYAHNHVPDPVCDVDVVDGVGIFTSVPALTQRVEDTQKATGAIIKIRTIQSYYFINATDIRTYKDYMVSRCTPWQGLDGKFQSNYILLVVSLQDRKSDYWVGDHWLSSLSTSKMEGIETGSMDPYFHTGMTTGDKSQFQAGMLAGLDQIQQGIDPGYWWAMNWVWVIDWPIVVIVIAVIVIRFIVRFFSGGGFGGGSGGSTGF